MVHKFSVGKSDEDNEHDNDDSGSRAIPARTFIGARAAIGKDHAWILEPLFLFWGLITIPEFMYRFKGSVAKYELMLLDVARVVYDKEPKEKQNKKKADAESIRLNEESLRKARERHKQTQWQEMKLSDLNTNT